MSRVAWSRERRSRVRVRVRLRVRFWLRLRLRLWLRLRVRVRVGWRHLRAVEGGHQQTRLGRKMDAGSLIWVHMGPSDGYYTFVPLCLGCEGPI